MTPFRQFNFKIHELCNERCIFCFQDHDSRAEKKIITKDEAVQIIYNAFKDGYRSIQFTGGEPLIHPEILLFIRFAKKVGFLIITVHTNGILLGNKVFLEKCLTAGLNTVHISIHHTDEKKNDEIVGVTGATHKTLAGIALLREYNVYTVIYIVLNEKNYRDIKTIVEDFVHRGIIYLVIMFPTIQGSMEELVETTMIKYDDAIPYIKDALSLVDGVSGRYIYLFNIPACLVPGYEKYVMTGANGVLRELDGSIITYFDQKQNSNSYTLECKTCVFRKLCPGIDAPYLEKYGKENFEKFKKVNASRKSEKPEKSIIDLIIQSKESGTIYHGLYLIRIFLGKPYLFGVSIPELGYHEDTPEEAIYNAIYDIYSSIKIEENLFQIGNAIGFFSTYHHVEFTINSLKSNSYRYILWFNEDKRYEILNYIFLSFPTEISRIKKLVQVFKVFEERKNPFHLGIDESTGRMKLYVGLYHDEKNEAQKIIQSLVQIFGMNELYLSEPETYKYDCIGIDITKDSIELKIYELIDAKIHPPKIIDENTKVKEVGYMKSLNGRKKLFFRLEKSIDLNVFGEDFSQEKILASIRKDSGNKIHPKEQVKYYCQEGDAQEIYFI